MDLQNIKLDNREIEAICPSSRYEWRDWLSNNGHTFKSIWVIYYKTGSGKPSMSWSDAVEEALCFGWIDSIRKTLDDERFVQYYSRRKPNSNWSAINKKKISELTAKGLMTKAGTKTVEIAKKNGSWNLLDEVEQLIVPADLKEALSQNGRMEFFQSLSKSNRKILLYWVVSAKREETRTKRVSVIAESADRKEVPAQFK